MVSPPSSNWSSLFEQAIRLIDTVNADVPIIDHWSFGGGTALMLQIDHRESFDIDIFIDDPQVLPYLNPERNDLKLDPSPVAVDSDGVRSLRLIFQDIGEVDFICAAGLTSKSTVTATVRERRVLLETPSEILAKKIFYRGTSMQPRDMFDIACVVKCYGQDEIAAALRPISHSCEAALVVARRMDPTFASVMMRKLLYRPNFADIPSAAQGLTIDLLEAVRDRR